MIINYSELVSLPIASLSERKKIGEIKDFVIDKDNLLVIGVLVKTSNSFFSKPKAILLMDILDIDKNGVTTKDEECLLDPKENIKIKNAVDTREKIIGLSAYTKNNIKIGKITDYALESTNLQVVKFNVKNWNNMERIFSYSNVSKITKNAIYFNNNEEKIASKINIMQTIDEK